MREPNSGRGDQIREVIALLKLALQDCYRLLAEEKAEANDNDRHKRPPGPGPA